MFPQHENANQLQGRIYIYICVCEEIKFFLNVSCLFQAVWLLRCQFIFEVEVWNESYRGTPKNVKGMTHFLSKIIIVPPPPPPRREPRRGTSNYRAVTFNDLINARFKNFGGPFVSVYCKRNSFHGDYLQNWTNSAVCHSPPCRES